MKESSFNQAQNFGSLYSDFFSENFLQATIKIFESINEAVLIVDKSYTVKFINEPATQLLQINKELALDGKIYEIVASDVRVLFNHLHEHLVEEEKQPVKIKKYIPSLKNHLYIQAYSTSDGTAYLLRHEDNKNQGEILTEQYYRILFDEHPDPVCLIDLDGQILSANLPFRELFQIKEDLRGKKFYYSIPEDKQKKAISLLDHIKKGKPNSVQVNLSEEFGFPYYIIATAIPIHINAHVISAYVMVKDITEEQKKLEELQQLYHMNRLIMESVQDGILGLDKDLNVVMWNRAANKMTGYNKEDISREKMESFTEQFDKSDMDIIEQWNSNSNRFEDTEDMILQRSGATLYRKNGTPFLCEYTISPMVSNGDVVGSVFTFRDISEKKKSEELLRQSEKLSAVGQLAAGIAHEIRNPLTSLRGFLQLIEINKGGKSEYFDIMRTEFGRIENILNELLILSKPQTQEKTVVNLQHLLNGTITLLKAQAIINNIDIVTLFPTKTIHINCIEHQIKQVLINIIKNAIESMDSGGTITAELEEVDGWAKIKISDEGCGISAEVTERMRNPFFTTKETGTGLGLMVTYQIIEEHGGKVEIESELGKGTRFIVYLPL